MFFINKMSRYAILLIKKSISKDILALSSQLAYNLLMAFFPFIIFLLTLVGYSDIDSKYIMDELQQFLPTEAYSLINNIVSEVVHKHNGSLMSLSLIITIWSAAAGFNAIISGLNKAYEQKERRGFFKVQLISLIFTFTLVVLIMFAVFLMVFGKINGDIIARYFGLSGSFQIAWNIFRFVITIAIMIFGFLLLYKYAPCRKYSFKLLLPGAIFASFGWIFLSLLFSYYVNNFSNYSQFYGSIGAVIILMLWLLISSIIIILGGEVNSIYIKNKYFF